MIRSGLRRIAFGIRPFLLLLRRLPPWGCIQELRLRCLLSFHLRGTPGTEGWATNVDQTQHHKTLHGTDTGSGISIEVKAKCGKVFFKPQSVVSRFSFLILVVSLGRKQADIGHLCKAGICPVGGAIWLSKVLRSDTNKHSWTKAVRSITYSEK